MGTLSVRENLYFSAALRLPTSMNWSEKKRRVEKVIGELGLTGCADTKVRERERERGREREREREGGREREREGGREGGREREKDKENIKALKYFSPNSCKRQKFQGQCNMTF